MTKKNQIWGDHLTTTPNEANIRFCAGRDVQELKMADADLIPFDIWTNLAHSQMLNHTGVMNDQEFKEIQAALLQLVQLWNEGKFRLDPTKEDVHINIEHYVTLDRNIEAGKKIHTGRSRNDQVATDMRLYSRHHLLHFISNLTGFIEALLQRAEKELTTYMPGFTHYQPAMWTTFAHWLTNWSQGMIRSLKRCTLDLEMLNKNPLGSAASFGTSWPINREYTAELLGFDGVEENTLDCISSRWELEAQIASSLALFMTQCSVIAQDLILLSHPYYDMVEVHDSFVTGSSIMPQKRNPDFAEVIRSKAAVVNGMQVSLNGIQKGSMSGYNRDSQQTKYLLMDLFRETLDVPLILKGVIETLISFPDRMRKQCDIGFMNSADAADWLASRYGLSFRDTYNVIALTVKHSQKSGRLTVEALNLALKEKGIDLVVSAEDFAVLEQPEQLINQKQHTGSPAKESVLKMIQNQRDSVNSIMESVNRIQLQSETARESCFRV